MTEEKNNNGGTNKLITAFIQIFIILFLILVGIFALSIILFHIFNPNSIIEPDGIYVLILGMVIFPSLVITSVGVYDVWKEDKNKKELENGD